MFKLDSHRSVLGQAVELASHFTWEAPQTNLGNLISIGRDIGGAITDVSYYHGATLVNRGHHYYSRAWGFTLGPYINSKNASTNPSAGPGYELFRHEYGHTLQSRILGPFYLPNVASPSLLSELIDANNNDRAWFETDANRLAHRYFGNNDPNTLDPSQGGVNWDYTEYPVKYNPDWFWSFILL